MHISGIKCDADGCDYQDESAKFENYKDYLGKPCPKCGANLLTEADYKSVQMLISACDWFNSLGIAADENAKMMKIKVEHDGSGIPKFECQKEDQP